MIMLNQGLGAILGMVSLVIVGRYIPVGDFGIVGFAMGLVGMLHFLGDLGFSSAHVKRMNEGNDLGECLGVYITIKLLLSALMAGTTLLIFFLWENVFGFGYESPDTPMVTMIILGYFVTLNVQHIFIFTFQSRMQTALQEIPNLIGNITRVVTLAVVAVGNLGLYLFASTYLFSALAGIVASALLFSRMGMKAKAPKRIMAKKYAVFAVPLILATSISVISINVDKVMIQMFWTSQEVAQYFMSQRIIMLVTALSGALGALIFPAVSKAHSKGELKTIKMLIKNAERYISLIIFPVVIFLIVFPRDVLHIIGDGYLAAAPILQVHILYAFFVVLLGIHVYTINGINKPVVTAKITLFMSLLNIGLNALFIPSAGLYGLPTLGLGAYGAALATLIAEIAGVAVLKLYVWKKLGVGFNWHFVPQCAAAIVTAFILIQIGLVLPPDRIYLLIPYFFVGAGIFVGILYLIREFKVSDYRHIMETVNPFSMAKYIKGELAFRDGDEKEDDSE
ncbi:MAG: flippase [Candidatus Thermoplasmatota archaeon]|nr:flippase [Candidatus Thermoplasmatota archaeon]